MHQKLFLNIFCVPQPHLLVFSIKIEMVPLPRCGVRQIMANCQFFVDHHHK